VNVGSVRAPAIRLRHCCRRLFVGVIQQLCGLRSATDLHCAVVQDDWRFNTKLTLNLGVRWDYESPLRSVITSRFRTLHRVPEPACRLRSPVLLSTADFSSPARRIVIRSARLDTFSLALAPRTRLRRHGGSRRVRHHLLQYAGTPVGRASRRARATTITRPAHRPIRSPARSAGVAGAYRKLAGSFYCAWFRM